MKAFFISLAVLLLSYFSEAQFIKRLGKQMKSDAEWRLRNKADQQVGRGLDSLVALPKKKKDKNPAGTVKTQPPGGNDMEPKDGHVTLKLSASKIFTGGSILISGESILYKNYKQVEIKVTGPSVTNTRNLTLSAGGKYMAEWNAPPQTGEYTVTVTGSDKKAKLSAKVTVEDLEILFADNWPEDNTRETKKALDKLEAAVARVEGGISPQNKAALDKKMDDLKDKVNDVLKLYKDLRQANKEVAQQVRKGKALPPTLSGNLSALNNTLADQATQLKQMNDVEHQPQDNTICEYLVMINEACAAFSTFTNVLSKSILTIVKNITLDKAVPKVVGVMEDGMNISSPYDFPEKEAAKIYAISKFDAQSLTEKLGKAGIAGDVMQFATDVLLKIYCGVFSGDFTHDYTIEFRNGKGQTTWSYGVDMKAVFTLRYPKKNITPTIIKMKGNLEGNATHFSFFEDMEKDDEFQEGTKGKIEIVPINVFIPLSVSVATSERDVMGFGAIARGLATPAYFNIPVDAEYDVDAKKVKIFINPAICDFTDLIAAQFVFLMIGGDLIPYPKKMNFPFNKAKTTIDAVVSGRNEFPVEKDAKGNESFSGKGNRHIGDKSTPRETNLNFTISAKKQ